MRAPTFRSDFSSWHARGIYTSFRNTHATVTVEMLNKAAAQAGLDLALPFLDRDLVSFLMAIPGEQLSYEGVPRAILRRGLRGVLPEAVARRRWKGDFSHRITDAMQEDLDLVKERLLSPLRAGSAGVLDQRSVDKHVRAWTSEPTVGYYAARNMAEALGVEYWLEAFC
jgi:asparagine synthase (glutamine-hydrolysing)